MKLSDVLPLGPSIAERIAWSVGVLAVLAVVVGFVYVIAKVLKAGRP